MRIPSALFLLLVIACGTPVPPLAQADDPVVADVVSSTSSSTSSSTTTTTTLPALDFAFAKISDPNLEDLLRAISAVDPLDFDDAHGFSVVIVYTEPGLTDDEPFKEHLEVEVGRDGQMTFIGTSAKGHVTEFRSDGQKFWASIDEVWIERTDVESFLIDYAFMVLNVATLLGLDLGGELVIATEETVLGIDVEVSLEESANGGGSDLAITPYQGTLRFDRRGTLVEAHISSSTLDLQPGIVWAEYELTLTVLTEPLVVEPPDPALVKELEDQGFEEITPEQVDDAVLEVQSNLRNALTSARVFYVDHEHYAATPAELMAIEPTLSFVDIHSATQQDIGFSVSDENMAIVFVVADASGHWWCIADTAYFGTMYGNSASLVEIDTIEECSDESW